MLFWPLANIDYIINSFRNRDQFSEAICEVITYQTHDRQKGVMLSCRTTGVMWKTRTCGLRTALRTADCGHANKKIPYLSAFSTLVENARTP